MELLSLENVSKYFDQTQVLDQINFSIETGETLVLLGPSGSGKTTLLKLINRLIDHEEGMIYFKGRPTHLFNPHELRRKMGYVIQDVGLFPHMTILENVIMPFKISGVSYDPQRINELMKLVNLSPELLERTPDELSGGQQQRIGIVRALATEPELLLMDEPFSALDNITRTQLQDDFLKLDHSLQRTVILVTHDVQEAFKLADRIVLFKQGKLQQIDTPLNFLLSPVNDFVKEFFQNEELTLKLNHIQIPHPDGKKTDSLLALISKDELTNVQKIKAMERFLNSINDA